MESIEQFEKFTKTLNDPYDIMIAICMGQFKLMIDAGNFDAAKSRLNWIKGYVKLQENAHRSNT